MRQLLFVLVSLAALLTGKATVAEVVSISGATTLLDPAPASVATDVLESDTEIFLFVERQNSPLSSNLAAVLASPGLSFSGTALPSTAIISAGTAVDSYLFHADKVGSAGAITVSGTASFDSDILAVIVRTGTLAASDPVIGSPTTAYSTATNRGLENVDDVVTISSDLRSIEVQFFHGQVEDEIRVITVASSNTDVPTGRWIALAIIALLVATQWWWVRGFSPVSTRGAP